MSAFWAPMHSHRFLGSANFLFGFEPVIEFGARLITAQNVELKGSSMDSFFERTRRELGFPCRCCCRHRCTSSDDGITDGNRTERELTRSWRPSWFAQGLMAFERRNLDARS